MNVTDVYQGISILHNGGNMSYNGSMGVLNTSSPLHKAINILSILLLFITMTSLGCTMEISKIRTHLLRPKGVAIAIVAQFGIMPLTAFCLAKLLKMDSIKAVTVLICGCCPGGNLSNIFALALKGDMNLSSGSDALAAPSLLPGLQRPGERRALCRHHHGSRLHPGALRHGHRYQSLQAKIHSGGLEDILWMILTADVLTVAALMPFIGFVLGFVMSTMCRLSPKCSRTISVETGCQNINLCVAILKVAFPPEVIGPMFLFPLLYYMFQCAEALFLTVCFRSYQMVKSPEDKNVYVQQDEEKQPECPTSLEAKHDKTLRIPVSE
ncbi:hepatic sodium/bile acid cotransporter-like isoform X2 [Nerophis lumbriciformis]|uniref:hepatic sodium/bile acid cotransporter-like isoform X2 n=1 Tax=Nerophis lumbriciformis TaxID=546530 RepID=UPI003BACE1BA